MMRHGKNRFVFSFLLIPVFLYVLFVVIPYIGAFALSLTRWTGTTTLDKIQFRGLQNFQRILVDDKFWNALSHNVIILIVMPVITLGIALFFAALFTQGLKASKFFRISFFFPQVMSVAVVAILWSFIFHPTFGILNTVLQTILAPLGIRWPNFPWLGDVRTVLGSVIVVAIWQAVGFYMVLFIAGMQSIPDEYYEAARIDGANGWSMFWKLTIPLLWETLRTAIIFIAIAGMSMFTEVAVLTNGTGGPSRAADVLSTYMYDQAFGGGNSSNPFGYGSAIGVVILILTLGLSFLSLRLTRRDTLEY
jgi:N-acetylglucosamine transport system permease protein